MINWDGGYAPCCCLTDKKQDFGDLNTHRVKQVWNNEHYQAARRLFKGERDPNVRVGCETCNVFLDSEAGKRMGMGTNGARNATAKHQQELPLVGAGKPHSNGNGNQPHVPRTKDERLKK